MPRTPFDSDLLDLPNLGRTTVQWLVASGIRSISDLQRVGAVAAWAGIRARGFRATRSQLYALHGALLGLPWRTLPDTTKADLWQQASTVVHRSAG